MDSTLECGDAKRPDQCHLNEVSSTLPSNCFWLYSSIDTSNDSGSCYGKDESSLSCVNAKRYDQCTLGDVTKLGENCWWLEGDSSRSPAVLGKCTDKVRC
jgi:hypothetical protein